MDPLVESARRGDEKALAALLESIAPAARRFGLRMCRNEADADDVLQETLLAVARNLPAFEGRSSLTSWVFTLARTACSRRRRGLASRAVVAGEDEASGLADVGADPEQTAVERERLGAVTRALDALPDDWREVILLRDVEGLSATEAAEALDLSVPALKSKLHRARAALRVALRPLSEELPRPSCPDVLEAWSRKLEGDLSAGDCATMEKHVEGCAACRASCDGLKDALAACRRSASDVVTDETRRKVRSALDALRATPT